MPIYEDSNTTREQLQELRRSNRCQVCSSRLDVFLDVDKGKAFLACQDWRRTQHEGIEREAPPPFEPNIETRRKDVEVKQRRGREKALSQKDRFLELSGTFGAFGRLLETTAGKTLLQAERDTVIAKVCSGLSEVCKMLAETKEGGKDVSNKRSL